MNFVTYITINEGGYYYTFIHFTMEKLFPELSTSSVFSAPKMKILTCNYSKNLTLKLSVPDHSTSENGFGSTSWNLPGIQRRVDLHL